jgi:hypothetical protein
MRRTVLLIAPLGLLAACHPQTSGAHWREVGSLDNGMVPLVEVDATFAKDGSIYRDATKQLCASRCAEVGFFLPGDAVPPSGPREDFYQAGGWSRYAPAAVYDAERRDFTRWDCIRAGAADAPLSALCGEGAKKEFDAVLRMAFRDRWTRGCRLHATDNRALLRRYFATLPQAKRDQLAAAYDEILKSSRTGPDHPADCRRLRSRIVDGNKAAWAFLAKRMASRARIASGKGGGRSHEGAASRHRLFAPPMPSPAAGRAEETASASPPPPPPLPPAQAARTCIRVVTDPGQDIC